MRLRSSTSQSLAVTAWDTATYVQWRQHKRLFDGVVYGVLLALLLYNLSLFYVLRNRSYGFYVATGLAALFTLSSFNGHAAQYLLGPWPWLQSIGNVLGPALWITLGAQFCRSFLDARTHLPRWDKVLQAVMAVGMGATAPASLGRMSPAPAMPEALAPVGTPAAAYTGFMADLLLIDSMIAVPCPVRTLKSSRRRASKPSQYSLFDSIQSILPWRNDRNATARKAWP